MFNTDFRFYPVNRHCRSVGSLPKTEREGSASFKSRVIPVFTRHDFITTSCRAAISVVVRECRAAGD
jgi:hypothetical protein